MKEELENVLGLINASVPVVPTEGENLEVFTRIHDNLTEAALALGNLIEELEYA